mmetsp:Transcript_24476/g.61559  ORF Transcript_24476/g.61559 Transcript_24476/m.61559 type:complete len:85 (+) Transcript_24476:138-392(+)
MDPGRLAQHSEDVEERAEQRAPLVSHHTGSGPPHPYGSGNKQLLPSGVAHQQVKKSSLLFPTPSGSSAGALYSIFITLPVLMLG